MFKIEINNYFKHNDKKIKIVILKTSVDFFKCVI